MESTYLKKILDEILDEYLDESEAGDQARAERARKKKAKDDAVRRTARPGEGSYEWGDEDGFSPPDPATRERGLEIPKTDIPADARSKVTDRPAGRGGMRIFDPKRDDTGRTRDEGPWARSGSGHAPHSADPLQHRADIAATGQRRAQRQAGLGITPEKPSAEKYRRDAGLAAAAAQGRVGATTRDPSARVGVPMSATSPQLNPSTQRASDPSRLPGSSNRPPQAQAIISAGGYAKKGGYYYDANNVYQGRVRGGQFVPAKLDEFIKEVRIMEKMEGRGYDAKTIREVMKLSMKKARNEAKKLILGTKKSPAQEDSDMKEDRKSDYSDSPKKEPMRKKGERVGSLTLNRKFNKPKIDGIKKRMK